MLSRMLNDARTDPALIQPRENVNTSECQQIGSLSDSKTSNLHVHDDGGSRSAG
jgi:hypothetical protein